MSKKSSLTLIALSLTGIAAAENLQGVDDFVCAPAQAQICLETGDCYDVIPHDIGIPDFLLFDTKRRTVSTTEASGLNRTTEYTKFVRDNGLITIQGVESDRAFSFIIHESTGQLTAAIARDGFAVTVFGACTDSDL